jgi:hypothetical protein
MNILELSIAERTIASIKFFPLAKLIDSARKRKLFQREPITPIIFLRFFHFLSLRLKR